MNGARAATGRRGRAWQEIWRGAEVGAEAVGKFFKDISNGIADVGRHLMASR